MENANANNSALRCAAWFKYCLFALLSLNLLATSHAQVSESEYTLGAGDLIKITVFGQDDLTLETRLSNVGYIRYPFLGDIGLVGKTVNQVEQLIDSGLRGDYLINPSVSVTVEEYRPFFIDGEVKRPGGYPYQPGLNIDKAAALAGGYTERAAKGQVIIRRTIGGVEQNFEFNSNEIIMPGDIVTVKGRFF